MININLKNIVIDLFPYYTLNDALQNPVLFDFGNYQDNLKREGLYYHNTRSVITIDQLEVFIHH
jgi:hypothetical protein